MNQGRRQPGEGAAVPRDGGDRRRATAYGNSVNVLTPDGQPGDLSSNMCVWNFELFHPCSSAQLASQHLLK